MSSDLNDQTASSAHGGQAERRRVERRRHVLRGLLLGSFHARRRVPRRASEQAFAAVDWHHPQWLATGTLIVAFSAADALLTLVLIDRGAHEVNPFMRPLLGGSAVAFALVKVGLTAGGVVLLTLLARMRALGRVSGGLLLYTLLAGYGALIFYEFRLLGRL